MMNKKLLILLSMSVVVALSSVGFMTTQDIAVRHIGAQYTPWDTDRMVEHSELIFSGVITKITPIVETEIEYYDGTYQIFDQKKVPYQFITIKVDEWIKGGDGNTIITVKDVANAVVLEGATLISVEHENAPTYEIGQKGTYFVEIINGEPRLDGFYSFLKEDTDGKKSSEFIKKTGKTPPTDLELIDKVKDKLK